MHPRLCPKCRKIIPINYGFHFDQQLNLIHDECDKVAFSTTGANDINIVPAVVQYPSYQSRPYTHVPGYPQHQHAAWSD